MAVLILIFWFTTASAGTVSINEGNARFSFEVGSYKENRFKAVTEQRYDFSCGSAAISTLLTYHYQKPVNEISVFRSMYKMGNKEKIRKLGFSMLDMKKYLEANGYRADGFRISLDRLNQVGVPGIMLINEEGYRHFVVIKGVSKGGVLFGDPAKGLRILRRSDFEKMGDEVVFLIRDQRKLGRSRFNQMKEWRAALNEAPLSLAVLRESLAAFTLLLPNSFDMFEP
jgi:hypothetical protein